MEGSPDSMASLGLSQTFFGQKLGDIRRVFCPPLPHTLFDGILVGGPAGRALINALQSAPLGFIEPQLLTSVDQPPQGDEWLHEIKHDGYRTLVVVDSGDARAYTRTGLDWTKRYPGIVNAAAKLKCRSAIFDGEVIVRDERGVSDFDALMSARSIARLRLPLAGRWSCGPGGFAALARARRLISGQLWTRPL